MEVGSGHHFIPIHRLFIVTPLHKTARLQGVWRIVRISLFFLSCMHINLRWGHNGGIFCRFHNDMPPSPFCNSSQEGNENHASL